MLKLLIDTLAEMPQHGRISFGFGRPMSYRGDYSELAFEPAKDVTVGSMLAHARSALGATFEGYKGGDYTMHEYADCYIADYGESTADMIGPTLMGYWQREAALDAEEETRVHALLDASHAKNMARISQSEPLNCPRCSFPRPEPHLHPGDEAALDAAEAQG